MSLEYADIKWTVVCNATVEAALDALDARALARRWHLEILLQDADGEPLPRTGPLPSETFGFASYTKGEGNEQYRLFWSTYSRGSRSQINGGLYLEQHVRAGESSSRACDRAFDDMLALFAGDDALCVVLAYEDDEIDVAPGIVGCYRPSLWQEATSSPLAGLRERVTSEGWVEVRPLPEHGAADDPVSVRLMNASTHASILQAQASLTAALWPKQRE